MNRSILGLFAVLFAAASVVTLNSTFANHILFGFGLGFLSFLTGMLAFLSRKSDKKINYLWIALIILIAIVLILVNYFFDQSELPPLVILTNGFFL